MASSLLQLRDLRAEAVDIKRRIETLKRRADLDTPEIARLAKLYSQALDSITTALAAAERDIQSVPDPRLRTVLRLKYCDGLTWTQVASVVDGRPDTAESLRISCRRYFRAQKI